MNKIYSQLSNHLVLNWLRRVRSSFIKIENKHPLCFKFLTCHFCDQHSSCRHGKKRKNVCCSFIATGRRWCSLSVCKKTFTIINLKSLVRQRFWEFGSCSNYQVIPITSRNFFLLLWVPTTSMVLHRSLFASCYTKEYLMFYYLEVS